MGKDMMTCMSKAIDSLASLALDFSKYVTAMVSQGT